MIYFTLTVAYTISKQFLIFSTANVSTSITLSSSEVVSKQGFILKTTSKCFIRPKYKANASLFLEKQEQVTTKFCWKVKDRHFPYLK